MKKENIIILFYFLYFSWLFTIAFLTPTVKSLNYFTIIVSFFYFIFLREKGDFFYYLFACLIPMFFAIFSFNKIQPVFLVNNLKYVPLWLPLAWGITIVALRKFYLQITK